MAPDSVLRTSRFSVTVHALERVEIRWMYGEEPTNSLHVQLVHGAVELSEALQVLTNERLLLRVLSEESLRDDIGNVLSSDSHLFETVPLHPPHRLGDELEARVVEQTLLYAGHEAEPRPRADLAYLAQEVEIENQLLLFTSAKEVEELIDDEQEPMVRIAPPGRRPSCGRTGPCCS